MRKILFILFLFSGFFAQAQDAKPVDANNKILITPNNVVWYYNTLTHKVGVWKGYYLYNEFFSAKAVQFKIDSLANIGYNKDYELEITSAGTSSYILPDTLRTKSQVWYNGTLLKKSQWTGIGTIYISISGNMQVKDYFTIIF